MDKYFCIGYDILYPLILLLYSQKYHQNHFQKQFNLINHTEPQNPSRDVNVAEKAHGRSRSSLLKYQRRLVDLSWLTQEGGANKIRFAAVTEHDALPVLSFFLQRTKSRIRQIGLKKTSPMRLLERTGMDAEISDISGAELK
jgi:hypothetical protein